MEEEDTLEREDLFDCCAQIFDQFENLNPKDDELTLIRFVESMMRSDVDLLFNIFKESQLKFEGKTAEDIFFDFFGMVMVLSFAMGYGIGTWRECPDPNIRHKVEKVRATIEERGLFHYGPRARA